MVANYQQLLDDQIQPTIMETVYVKMLEELISNFSEDTNPQGGPNIVRDIRTSISSNASNYDRTDVDPSTVDFGTVQASWAKTYQHGAAEVHGIDESEGANGGIPAIRGLLQDAIALEMGQIGQLQYNNIYARLGADIDATTAYSDNSISRSTYPTLASTEEATDTAITIALMRAHSNAVRLNKNSGGKSRFTWMLETSVYEIFEPLAAALHTWNVFGEAGKPIAAGYQPIGNFEGTDVVSPDGMTTGDVYFFRKEDVKVRKNRDLKMEQVASGRDSVKVVIRTGLTAWVDNPGFQGKMTNKD